MLLRRGWHRYIRRVPELITIDQARRILRKIGPAIENRERERLAREELERQARDYERELRKERDRELERQRRVALLRKMREQELQKKHAVEDLRRQKKEADKQRVAEQSSREVIKSFDGDSRGFLCRIAAILRRSSVRMACNRIFETRQIWRNGFTFAAGHVVKTSTSIGVVEGALDPHPVWGRSLVRIGDGLEVIEIHNAEAANLSVWANA